MIQEGLKMGKSDDKVLPFITTVVNDIYEKISGLQASMEKLGGIMTQINDNFKNSCESIIENINEMLEETRMNRDLALEAFSDSMNALLTRIQEIQDEKEKTTDQGEMKSLLSSMEMVAKSLNEKYWDIQMMVATSNLHSLVDILRGNTQIIQVPVQVTQPIPTPKASRAIKAEAAVPVKPQPTEELDKKDVFAKSPKFKDGRKKKTHEDVLKEMERKKKLFGKY